MGTSSVNVFFTREEVERIAESSDRTEIRYLILQNNELHAMYQKQLSANVEAVAQIADLEEDNESLEKTRTCMRGYVKNEASKFSLADSTVDMFENLYYYTAASHQVLAIGVIVAACMNSMALGFGICVVTCGIMSRNTWLAYNSSVKYREAIKKTMMANDHLEDLLDNM